MIDQTLLRQLKEEYQRLLAEDKLITRPALAAGYENFRRRFGPDRLARLDGVELLEEMHGRGSNDRLMYWLEYKNDDELRSVMLGNIGGGSALKFGLFFRRETETWFAAGGSPGGHAITVAEAIRLAGEQRDQLLAGARLLEDLPANATDEHYRRLQEQMNAVAPIVSDAAWGHKYFHLIAPDKVDCYHTPVWQRFMLLKMLQLPPAGEGRYLCAGRFVELARELDAPMNHAMRCLETFGCPYRYWRVGTSDGKRPRNRWDMMRDGQFVAVGWADLGDLQELLATDDAKAGIRRLLEEKEPNTASALSNAARQITHFGKTIAIGDLVVAADGGTVLGIGQVMGEYSYEPGSDFPHRRTVRWLSHEEWKLPQPEGLQTTVCELGKYPENLLEIEKRSRTGERGFGDALGSDAGKLAPLLGIPARIQAVLERKSQVILYGPPGTGKTYWAERTAHGLAARATFGRSFEQLNATEREAIIGTDQQAGQVRLCCFHPAYGYEDFIEGYRPETVDGRMTFTLRTGVFKQLCHDAVVAGANKPFYLIVDEINRGDIPRIFGELLTVLEKDKRGKSIALPVSGQTFRVPPNVFLIGTMNTADRSISLLDAALRRRFGFVELMPDASVLGSRVVDGIPLGPWLDALNRRIRKYVGRDARHLQVGHAYLWHGSGPVRDFATFRRLLRDDILPLLEEYCYDDFDALENILGKTLWDAENRCLRQELFEPGAEEQLRQALMERCSEIDGSPVAILAEQSTPELIDAVEDDAEEAG